MEYIPVLYLSKAFNKKEVKPIYLRDIMKKHGYHDLYVIDELGITRNEPDYTFYQRFSPMFDLWVDTGPRDIGDVVDDIFSGAKRIIIRSGLWNEESLQSIRNLTDHEIFIAVDGNHIQALSTRPVLYQEADGIIMFMTSQAQIDFKSESKISQLIREKPVYVFDGQKNEVYWNAKKIKGLLLDINTIV